MDINFNGWKEEEDYRIRYQLMFEAELELLKREDGGKNTDFLRIGEITVGGIAKDCQAELKLHRDAPPAISVSKDGKYVGMFYLKDIEKEAVK